ncbi:MAG: hybrid sensor histidine kinase/response regulator [Bermanella sp.]
MIKKFHSTLLQQDNPINPVNEARLDMLLKQTQVTGFLSIILSGLLAYLMFDSPHGSAMIIWVFLVAFVFFLRWGLFYRKINQLRKQGVNRFPLYHCVIVSFLFVSGVLWGGGVYLFFPSVHQVELFVTFITVVVGITAGNMPSFAPSFIGYMLFMVPTLMGVAFKSYEYNYDVLFTSVIIYLGYLALTAKRMSAAVIETICINIENTKLLTQVTQAKEYAEKANIQKSKFLASASHDLRQPLNSMGLFLYAFAQTLKDKQPNLNVFKKIQLSYEALKELFDALLEVSRLDAGNVECDIEPVALTPLLTNLVDELNEQANNKHLDIVYKGNDFTVMADRILLSRIVRNLLENAIKYTEQGKITVEELQQDQILTLSIKDTGIGIAEDELENIFDEYHQLSNNRRDRRQGIGLGLAIVKKLAALMGYEIKARSVLGQGSSFSIGLNIAKRGESKTHQPQLVTPTKPELTLHRILVVDDDPDSLLGLGWLLESWGYQVDKASSYEEALAIIKQNSPDIILMDYRLQDNMNGIQVLLKLAKQIPTPVEAIIISGDTDPEILQHIKGNGFMCLHKPIVAEQLQIELNKLIT